METSSGYQRMMSRHAKRLAHDAAQKAAWKRSPATPEQIAEINRRTWWEARNDALDELLLNTTSPAAYANNVNRRQAVTDMLSNIHAEAFHGHHYGSAQ